MSVKETRLKFNQHRRLPMIFQDERANCGHACVAMISQYWGHHLDLYTLKTLQQTSSRGTTLLDITQLFEPIGFMTRALRVPLEELSLIQCPAILHWNMNHFVVLKAVKKNHVLIHDPASGVRRCTWAEVSQSFTGIALEVTKTYEFKPLKSDNKLGLLTLLKTMSGVNTFIALLMIVSLLIEVLNLLNPLFIQYITDDAIGFGDPGNIYVIAIGFLIIIAMHGFMEYIRGNMTIYLSHQLTEQFSSNVVKHLLSLPLFFFEKRHKGDIQSKFQSIDDIQKKLSTDFIHAVLDGLMILINMIVMLIYSRLLTMMVIFMLLINIFIRRISYQSLKKQTELSVHQQAKANSLFLETLTGMMPIKSFLKEQTRFSMWRQCNIHAQNARIRMSKMTLMYQMMEQWLSQVEYIGVVCFGATLVLSKQLSLGMLMAFLSYRLLLMSKATMLIKQWFDYKLLSIQLDRLSDLLFQKPEVIHAGFSVSSPIMGALSLKNVCFKYNEHDKFILKDLSLHIQAGEKVAIVGPSGCGKSTCLKVMMGLLEKTSGEIFIDHRPLTEIGLKNYRQLTASVMQEDVLLTGSILDNISFFDDNIDMEWVYHVATLMAIHEVISQLPMGYETLIGEMGSTLSGGQKQRLLLARALYKKPKLLFLDEATSHLDVAHERHINQALTSLNITQIIVAHREETIQMADRVIYFNQN